MKVPARDTSDDPIRRGDSRWVHRGNRPRDRYAQRDDITAPAGRVFRRLTKLISVRQATPEFAGGDLIGFRTPHASVIGYQRPGAATTILVLANVGDALVDIDARTLSGFESTAFDLINDIPVELGDGLRLPAHGFAWLRVTPA